MSVVILISGRGSNMQAILEAGIPVAAVISNRADAAGLAIAAQRDVATAVVDHRRFASREALDAALAAAFIVVGGLFQPAFLRLEDKQFVEGGLTGIGTVYVFMTKLVTVGFGIALLLYLRTRQRLALMLLLLGGLFFFEKIVLSGRRAQMAELLLVTGLAFWYVRGRAIPRVLMIAALVAGAFVVAAIGQYRAVVLQEDTAAEIEWGDVAEIDFVGAFQGYVAEGPELRIAARDIAGLSRTGTFDYGLSQWNGLVFGFVPAQFVGRDLKDSLMVNLDNTKVLEESLFGASGATRTGLSDAFASLWYFGALIFFAIGWIFGRFHGLGHNGRAHQGS